MVCLLSCCPRAPLLLLLLALAVFPDVGPDPVGSQPPGVGYSSGVSPEFGDDSALLDAAPSPSGAPSPVQSSER